MSEAGTAVDTTRVDVRVLVAHRNQLLVFTAKSDGSGGGGMVSRYEKDNERQQQKSLPFCLLERKIVKCMSKFTRESEMIRRKNAEHS